MIYFHLLMTEERGAEPERLSTEALVTIKRLQEGSTRLELEIKLLREKLHMILRRMWGAKSEQIDDAQMLLLLQGVEEESKKPESPAAPALADDGAKKKCERAPRKPVFPENLPVEQTILEPEEVLAEPEQFRCIGEEVSEQYDYHPPQFFPLGMQSTRRIGLL